MDKSREMKLGKRIDWNFDTKTCIKYKLNNKLVQKILNDTKYQEETINDWQLTRNVENNQKNWVSIIYRTKEIFYEHAWQTIVMDVIQRFKYMKENGKCSVFTFFDLSELKEQNHDEIFAKLGILNCKFKNSEVLKSYTNCYYVNRENDNRFIDEGLVYMKVFPPEIPEEVFLKIPFVKFIEGAERSELNVDKKFEKFFRLGIPKCGSDAFRLSCLEACDKGKLNDSVIFNNVIFIDEVFQFVWEFYKTNDELRDEVIMVKEYSECDKMLSNHFRDLVESFHNGIETFDFKNVVVILKRFFNKLKMYWSLKSNSVVMLNVIIRKFLHLIHPVLPFLTNSLFSKLYGEKVILECSFDYPNIQNSEFFEHTKNMEALMTDVSSFMRRIKGCYRLFQKVEMEALILEREIFECLKGMEEYFSLVNRHNITFNVIEKVSNGLITKNFGNHKFYFDITNFVSVKSYKQVLNQKIKKINGLMKKKKIEDDRISEVKLHLEAVHLALKKLIEEKSLDVVNAEIIRKFDLKECMKKKKDQNQIQSLNRKKAREFRKISGFHFGKKTNSWEKVNKSVIENSSSSSKVLKVCCYNVLHDMAKEKEDILKSTEVRFKLVTEILRKQDAAVIILNEVTQNCLDVFKECEYIQDNFVLDRIETTSPMQNQILVSKKLDKVEFYVIKIREISNTVAALITIEDVKVLITNTHYKAARRQSKNRANQYQKLTDKLKEIGESNKIDNLVMCGDFNTNTEYETDFLINELGFEDCWIEKHGDNPGYTINPMKNKLLKALNPFSWRRKRYDRILKKSFSERVVQCEEIEIFATEELLDNKYPCSDHYGIFSIFKVK